MPPPPLLSWLFCRRVPHRSLADVGLFPPQHSTFNSSTRSHLHGIGDHISPKENYASQNTSPPFLGGIFEFDLSIKALMTVKRTHNNNTHDHSFSMSPTPLFHTAGTGRIFWEDGPDKKTIGKKQTTTMRQRGKGKLEMAFLCDASKLSTLAITFV